MKCKKRQSIRASAVILLAGILLSLASCTRAAAPGGETPSGEPSAPTVPIEHAYRETALPVNIKGAAMLAYSGGRIYFDRQDAPGGPSVVSASLDGSEETVVWSREAEEPYSEMMGYSLTCFTADGEGNLFTVSRYVYPDDNDPNMPAYRDELTKTSPDGTELYSVDLTTLLDGAPVEVFGIAADGAGNAYLLGGGGMSIYALDGAAGALKFTVSENSPVMNITHSGDGSVIYAAMGFDPGASDMTYSMKTIDYAAGTASEMPPNAGDTFTDFSGIFAGAGDNAFFARFANKIYGFKSGDMTAEVIVDLLNSDIDPA
ncbi:MAG: hypothetical protein LBK23_05790, partial [Oscillospiraceae bacterium]|nr:hypothetical protein [Oscillospiraceae bacterium]